MRGDKLELLPEDLTWAANYFFGEDSICKCDSETNHICENCFLHTILNRASGEIKHLRKQLAAEKEKP